MPDHYHERLEHQARESLVADDLSAKMKQWQQHAPPPKGKKGGGPLLPILLMLLALGGAAWLFWPSADANVEPPQPSEAPTPLPPTDQPISLPAKQEPMAEKPASPPNRYLALAQAHYRAPDFGAEIRGDAPATQNWLNDARRALAEGRYADALNALEHTPAEYQTDADYLRGHALFGLKKYAQAASTFGSLTQSLRYGEAAQWYETLALLPDCARHKSLILSKLEKISADSSHAFQREAARLSEILLK
jgi:tetratricopeptide (TPR) repeat protein